MKINIAYPATGCLKKLEIDDDQKLRAFYDKRISNEIVGEALGDEFKGYILKIKGGCDNQGFPMKHGNLTPGRVRLLLVRGTPCFVVLEGEMVNAEGNLYWLYCEPMPFSYQLGHCEEGRQRSSWAH